MQVQVLYFGILREQNGTQQEPAELADGSTVADLLRILRSQSSNRDMTRIWETLAVAVNREYASASHMLREGDEVALLPPVSGGLEV